MLLGDVERNISVEGKVIDKMTRCEHYYSILDIVAIKFKCCQTYYPCFKCHSEEVKHDTDRWTEQDLYNEETEVKVILCGSCWNELTFREYVSGSSTCPSCSACFNPKCELHYDLYFDLKSSKK